MEELTGSTTFHFEHQLQSSGGQQAVGAVTRNGGMYNTLLTCWSERRNQVQKVFRREFLLIPITGSFSKWGGVCTGGTLGGRRLLVGEGEL